MKQIDMLVGGRTFRRKTAKYRNVWLLPPLVEGKGEVLVIDVLYLGRHERLIMVKNSIVRLLKESTIFTYLEGSLRDKIDNISSVNNPLEGGINSRLRAMLRDYRGLSIERRKSGILVVLYALTRSAF